MSYGGKMLFDRVTTTFTPHRRYGLTGPNGAGKSTFMKILHGEIEPNSGTVTRPKRVGVLRQNTSLYDDKRIIDTVLMGNPTLWAALEEREHLYAQTDFTDEMGMRLAELEGVVADENGYVAEVDAAQILEGIGIAEAQHADEMRTLPSDLKFRVLLAQALFGTPDALLLDEPTNYLDLTAISWLETSLKDYNGTLIVISHDRHFLNAVCTHIADIDYDTIITYTGNYDEMVSAKVATRGKIESENRDKAKKVAQLQEFVARFAAGTRASQVQSRIKEIERLAPDDLKRSNIQRPYIRFDQERPSGRDVLEVKNVTFGYDPAVPVIERFSLTVNRGERIALLGNNGVGKTTLIRLLMGEITPQSGTIAWAPEVSSGYFPQTSHELFDANLTSAFDWLDRAQDGHGLGKQEVRGLLGRMLFSGEAALKPVKALSGGEAARLLLARMTLLKPNALLFDEPTNHLDLESVSALAEAMEVYKGTVLFASHDRDLVEKVATRLLILSDDGIRDFNGTYADYQVEQDVVPAGRR